MDIIVNLISCVLVLLSAGAVIFVMKCFMEAADRWDKRISDHSQHINDMGNWFRVEIHAAENSDGRMERVRGYRSFIATLRGADHHRALWRFVEESVKCGAMFSVLGDGCGLGNEKKIVAAAVAARPFLAATIKRDDKPDEALRARKLILLGLKKRPLDFLDVELNRYDLSLVQAVVDDEQKKEAKRNRAQLAPQA